MIIGGKNFDTENRTYVMGILNVTPDSFSDGGRWCLPEAALEHARELVREGADIIDVGGESTRPGASYVEEEEEIRRILPVIKAIKRELDIPVSVDTYKAHTAMAAIEAGADMINDVWGFKKDADMARVAADTGAACCLMHNRESAEYSSFLSDVRQELSESVDIALRAGINADKIVLDPGIGFAKSQRQNLLVLDRLEELFCGYPMLVGASGKSLIGYALNLPVDKREEASVAAAVIAAYKGAAFVRVHNVRAHRRAVDMARAVAYGDKYDV